ncbi:MAG: DUF488 family protein [Lentisphaeria bacterium]|nr:DUF488 family protein [Lentisphaeria bacterium]
MNSREQVILRLLKMRGGKVGRLDLIKLLFLTRENLDIKARKTFYGFVPYKYGPYSFAAGYDLDKLRDRGYLSFPDDRTVALTDVGYAEDRRMKSAPLIQSMAFTDMRTRGLNTDGLLDKVYRSYPWFTLNTVRLGWHPPERPVAEPAVYTVGYEGVQIDDFLDRLLRVGIKQLIDVRKNPVARRYGFHRSTLAALCHHIGVDYLHLPVFGITSEMRQNLDSDAAYDSLFRKYRQDVLPPLIAEIQELALSMTEKPSALMCAEENPRHCHRTHLAAVVAENTGMAVRDITGE